MVTVRRRSSLTSAEGHLGCIFHHPCLSRMIWGCCHPNPNEVVTMSAQSRCCVHYASIHVQEAHEGWSQGGRSLLHADSVSVINISITRSTDCNTFTRPWSWVVSEPQSIVNCKGTPVMPHHGLSWKWERMYLPPNSSTRQRNRYPIIYPILLLGMTHAPIHFPVVSSTTAQIGKPILYNFSWPSPAQRSWMPIGTFATWKIFFELGSWKVKPLLSWVCITSDMKSRGKCCLASKAIFAWIVLTPCRLDGSLSIWSITSCSASCNLLRHILHGGLTSSETKFFTPSLYWCVTDKVKAAGLMTGQQWLDSHLIFMPWSLNRQAEIFLLFVSSSLWYWCRAPARTSSSALAVNVKWSYWAQGNPWIRHIRVAPCWFFPVGLQVWDIDMNCLWGSVKQGKVGSW